MILPPFANRARRCRLMLDLVMVALGVALFGGALGYVALCGRL